MRHFRLRDLGAGQQASKVVRNTLPAGRTSNQGPHGVCPPFDGLEVGQRETRDFDNGPR